MLMGKLGVNDSITICAPGNDFDVISSNQGQKGARGIIKFDIKDRNGNIVKQIVEPNIVKIFAKEMLSHRLPSSEIWDPSASGGSGAWVDTGRDSDEEFSARYILFGASFDSNGLPLDVNDERFYATDPVTNTPIPVRLGPGAEYSGGLINAIPIAEPDRPLKRIEDVSFRATYQPAGQPLLQADVRALHNIVSLQTTLELSEYNGIGLTDSDFFTITEVALAGGKKVTSVGSCELTPRDLFLEGTSDGSALNCTAGGSDIITIAGSESEVDLVKEGDQIKITGVDDSVGGGSIEQVSPFYLVLTKAVGGRDIQLDRTPVDSDNNPITGSIGIYRDTLRIFSHRVLAAPVKKSADFEIEVVWTIIFN
jgi:hypothetical protein